MFKWVLVFSFFFFILSTKLDFAQTIESADSLKGLLDRKEDSVKVDILNQLVIHLREGNNVEAMQYAEQARDLSEKLNYKRGLAGVLGNIGWIHYRRGEFPAALEQATQSLAISESIKDYDELGRGLNNLASIYVEQKDYTKALSNFKQALAWGKKTKNKYTIGRSYNNIAYVFFLTNQLDSSKRYAESGVIATQGYSAGFAWRTLGDIYEKQNKIPAAEKNYLKSIAVADSNKNYTLRVSTAHRLGKMYLNHGQSTKAEYVLKANEELCSKFHFRNELVNTYKLLALLYKGNSDFGKATSYYEKFISLNDSLYNETTVKQLAMQEDRYKSQLQQSKIDLLTKESELKDKEIKTQRLTSVVAVIVLMLFIALATLLYRSNQKIKSTNQQLEQKNTEILAHDEELSRLNATKDKLFSIISHDLRGPFNSLSGLLHMNEKGYINEGDFKKHIEELSKNTFRTKELLNNLLLWSTAQLKIDKARPVKFNIKSVVNEVILLYESPVREKDIKIVNQVTDQQAWADADMISVVLRNILSNAIKFSFKGSTITIGSSVENHELKCFVKDEGQGIPKIFLDKLISGEIMTTKGTANEVGTGLGLQLCIDFVNKNGGRLGAESEGSEGATFWFTLPLKGEGQRIS
ncbi:MAG: tetratricopeptide repeat protein [Bacteroidetes bacterium]|nr:tetratricopeptide repeat protein [Bacteroidota bacterium]MBI3483411.1 tetratricopeptide repeat protein [Bacteroidota bacterium]